MRKRAFSAMESLNVFLLVFSSLIFLMGLLFVCIPEIRAGRVTVEWDRNKGSGVAGYMLYYGTNSEEYQFSVDVGNNTSCVISGLEEGKTYYFAATAYDMDDNESNFSAQVSVHISGSERTSGELKIEVGEAAANDEWRRVDLQKTFVDPVVVAGPLSYNGSDPAVVRIRNVDNDGFEIQVQEWEYLDGWHVSENLGYAVMESGTYTLRDGTCLEAGWFTTNKSSTFGAVKFSQTFQVVPVVVASVSSFNEPDAVAGRLRNISRQGFEFRMQEQERNFQSHPMETISFIAWEPSSGTLGDLAFEVNKAKGWIASAFKVIQFDETFAPTSVFLADMQTSNGGDTANLRCMRNGSQRVSVKVDEEQSRDSEKTHAPEIVGYMSFSQ